jgi:hypothetical protein
MKHARKPAKEKHPFFEKRLKRRQLKCCQIG